MEAAGEIFHEHDTAIMVGGTGLFIKAFTEGLDDIPAVEAGLRNKLVEAYTEGGMAWLLSEVQERDPAYFSRGEIQNPQRMLRALEVKISTGRSILDFRSKQKKARPFRIVKFGLELPRAELYDRINKRVDHMMAAGLLAETEILLPYQKLNALQTVGYRELFDHLEGRTSLDRAVELIKQNSRHYAKRQMTWFKKDPDITWVGMEDPGDALKMIIENAGIEPTP